MNMNIQLLLFSILLFTIGVFYINLTSNAATCLQNTVLQLAQQKINTFTANPNTNLIDEQHAQVNLLSSLHSVKAENQNNIITLTPDPDYTMVYINLVLGTLLVLLAIIVFYMSIYSVDPKNVQNIFRNNLEILRN